MTRFEEIPFSVRRTEMNGETIVYRAFEHIVTVEHPADASLQAMNLYVPEAYYHDKAVGGYSLHTAPILFENNIGGYMPSAPQNPEHEMFGRTSTFFYALQHGYVVAAPGARGRTNRTADGVWYGKAPAALVDLKAALRWLWANAGQLPGDIRRIVSAGTSAGGNFAALTGAFGNAADCAAELRALGACEGREDVFAVCSYCPITDLEHADSAYEWQFRGIADYHRMHMDMREGSRPHFTAEDGAMPAWRTQLSEELAALFPAYLNSYAFADENGRPLRLNADGSGSFRDFLCGKIGDAANQAAAEGAALDNPALILRGGKVEHVDFGAYMKGITRMKEAPAFDDVTMQSFENDLFGTAEHQSAHFSDFSFAHSRNAEPRMADAAVRKVMNPLPYLQPGSSFAPHWRIRQGTKDRDIGFASAAILSLALQKAGADVDYALVWDVGHDGDYDYEKMFRWIDALCDKERKNEK